MAQRDNPIKNNFYQTALTIITELGITETPDEIKCLKRSSFSKIVKEKCTKTAFQYLKHKQEKGSKGSGIKYTCLSMAELSVSRSRYFLERPKRIIFNKM